MYQKERLDRILALLAENGYMTVKALTEELHYSTATVNRDLCVLEQLKEIKRSWGGVELPEKKSIPLPYRYEKQKNVKKRIARAAAAFVENGDVIMIDSSTSTEYMGEYLLDKKDIHVITTNISLASFVSEGGIPVTVIGGDIIEPPSMTGGDLALLVAKRLHADKYFFSTHGFTKDGIVSDNRTYHALRDTLADNAGKLYMLADSDKLLDHVTLEFRRFSELYAVISDYSFPEEVKQQAKDTVFVEVEGEKKA